MNNKTLDLTRASLIAALYVVLTIIANAAGMASGAIQLRLSEMLTILPVFTWAAVPGLTLGCVIANLVTGHRFRLAGDFFRRAGHLLHRKEKTDAGTDCADCMQYADCAEGSAACLRSRGRIPLSGRNGRCRRNPVVRTARLDFI